ncbi:MAG TPA: hypothetical protein VF552_11745 [Allosphingosinicella sp.]|jgi:hypothetical protein
MTTPEELQHARDVRARQRSRSVVMAFALLAFAALMFFITIARMSGG